MRHKTGGRVKGTPNKVTADVRAAIAAFAEANISKLQTWLDAIAAKDPARAAELLLRALEYQVSKLARTEVKQDASEEPQTFRIVFVPPRERTKELEYCGQRRMTGCGLFC